MNVTSSYSRMESKAFELFTSHPLQANLDSARSCFQVGSTEPHGASHALCMRRPPIRVRCAGRFQTVAAGMPQSVKVEKPICSSVPAMNSIGFPRRPNVEFRHLRVFAEVVRNGGFTRAAEVIHATQSTVSKAISQLENEVGKPLLRRHRRGIELTRVGEIVYRRAQAMLAQRDLLADELHALAGNPHTTLKLGFSRMETSAFFGRALAEFRRRHPEVEISIAVEAESQIVRRVLKGDLDLAGLVSPRDPDLEVLELQREPVYALVSRENPLSARTRIGITDLKDQQLVLFEEKCQLNEMVVGALAEAGILAPVAIKTSQVGLIHELVAEDIGVGFLPRVLARNRLHPMVVALPMDDFESQWTYALAWSRTARLSPTARAWIAVARAVHTFPDLGGEVA